MTDFDVFFHLKWKKQSFISWYTKTRQIKSTIVIGTSLNDLSVALVYFHFYVLCQFGYT